MNWPLAIVLTAMAAGLGLIIWQWTKRRRPAYVTVHGVKVFASPSGKVLPKETVERIHEGVIGLWGSSGRGRSYADLLQFFNGARLGFVDTPKVFYKGKERDARGQCDCPTRTMEVSIAWPVPTVISLMGHEADHLAMFALGIPEGDEGENHHRVAAAAGSPY